jgi:hypothetical protein
MAQASAPANSKLTIRFTTGEVCCLYRSRVHRDFAAPPPYVSGPKRSFDGRLGPSDMHRPSPPTKATASTGGGEEPHQNPAIPFHSGGVSSGSAAAVASRRLDRSKWLLLLLPMLLATGNSSWLFTSTGTIDPWVYFGYFQHLATYKSTLFPNLYYGSRLPWILPGFLAYHWLRPSLANYALHFAFYYAATFSFYSLLRRAAGPRNALIGTILFGTYAHFLSAIGWDYVDGAGITYFLVALAAAANATRAHHRQWLVVSGVAGLAMCYTNLFLVSFLPFVVCLYPFLKVKGLKWNAVSVFRDVIVWFGAGAVLISFTLGAINYALDGNIWFYSPSVAVFFALTSHPNPWRAQTWAWVRDAYWLGIPAITLVASIAYAFREVMKRRFRFGEFRTFFVLQFIIIACGMAAYQAEGSIVLSVSYYASYLIPSMFLAIGCLLSGAEDERHTFGSWVVIAGSVTMFVVSLHIANGEWVQELRAISSAEVVAALAAAGLLCNVVFRRQWYMVIAAVVGLVVYQFGYGAIGSASEKYESNWRHVVEGATAVWPYAQKGRFSFWYNASGPHGLDINAINSVYLWGYTSIGFEFPKLAVPSRLLPGTTIVMLDPSTQSLDMANRVLRENHVQGSLAATYTVGHEASPFTLGFLTLEPYPPQ